MFYSQFKLAKKGMLGTIWIAAPLERKLCKNQVLDTDVRVSVEVETDLDGGDTRCPDIFPSKLAELLESVVMTG